MPFLSMLSGVGGKVWAGIAAVGAFLVAVAVGIAKIKQAGRNEVVAKVNEATAASGERMVEAAVNAPSTKAGVSSRLKNGTFCIAFLSALLLGCTPTIAVKVDCPPLKKYDAETQAKADKELAALPDDSALVGMIIDYGQLRDVVRACKAVR